MLFSKYNNHPDLYGLALLGVWVCVCLCLCVCVCVCPYTIIHAYTIIQHSLCGICICCMCLASFDFYHCCCQLCLQDRASSSPCSLPIPDPPTCIAQVLGLLDRHCICLDNTRHFFKILQCYLVFILASLGYSTIKLQQFINFIVKKYFGFSQVSAIIIFL